MYQHLEKINGKGYPRGLTGDQILTETKILSVADVVDSMLTHRPYRSKFTLQDTIDFLQKGSGSAFDPEIVDVCVNSIIEMHNSGNYIQFINNLK